MTLLEIAIALSISGFAIVGGAALLQQIADSNKRIGDSRTSDATNGNGIRLLRRLLSDAHPGIDTSQRFHGDEYLASYLTLCDVPSGWSEGCRASLMIDSLPDSTAIVAETDRDERFVVRKIRGNGRFRYLDVSSRDSVWVREWSKSIVLPVAIAIVTGGDTTILPLGSVRD